MIITETSEPAIPILLTADQRHAVVDALYSKLVEAESYLVSYRHEHDEPGAMDSCCDAHLARWRARVKQRDSLRRRQALIEQTIAVLEAPDDPPPHGDEGSSV